MSAPDRRELIDRQHGRLSIRRQCELLGIRDSASIGHRRRPTTTISDCYADRTVHRMALSWFAADDSDAARAAMCP